MRNQMFGRRVVRPALVLGLISSCLLALAGCTVVNAPPFEVARVEAERLVGGRIFADAAASGHSALALVANGSASGAIVPPVTSTWLQVRARGDQCAGAPLMTVFVDGRAIATTSVAATGWSDYGYSGAWAAGRHIVGIGFSNDHRSSTCDRNLRVDYVTFRSTVPAPIVGLTNEFAGASFYVDPTSTAATRATALRAAGDTADAALLSKIAGGSEADWFTDSTPAASVTAAVGNRVDTVAGAGGLPVLVAYAIPGRDCGGASAGGVATDAAYATWITNFAAGIGSRRAAVVLEPDSLAQWDCLSVLQQQARSANLRKAVTVLSATGTVAVYLDGGHADWQPVSVMADRLRGAGVTGARGFATNVANFGATSAEVTYGDALAAALGGKHYVVDTSRNGVGPAADFCNPAGQALGARSTTGTASSSADAYFWIKRPGESDGACNGGPPAGQWFESYALGLAALASF
jgi:endoglucanase